MSKVEEGGGVRLTTSPLIFRVTIFSRRLLGLTAAKLQGIPPALTCSLIICKAIHSINNFLFCCTVAAHNVTTVCGQANLDEAMTCNCTADSDLEFTSFQWRAPNDTVLHNGSSFTTARVEASLDGKHYTCVASSSFGQEARGRTTPFNVLCKFDLNYFVVN